MKSINPSSFQLECERRLIDRLHSAGIELENRTTNELKTPRISGDPEYYVYFDIPRSDLQIWIYDDEAMLKTSEREYIFEVPDYPDEAKRIELIVDAVTRCAQGRLPKDDGSSVIYISNQ